MAEILVTLSTFGQHSSAPMELLEASEFSYEVNDSGKRMTPAEVVEKGSDVCGLVAGVEPYGEVQLSSLERLECISRVGAGIDSIDLGAAERRGVVVRNTPNVPTQAVAEQTLAFLLGLMRKVPVVDRGTRSREWKRVTGRLLGERTVGIVGLGRIGRRVVEFLKPFGCRLVGCDPYVDKEWVEQCGIQILDLEEMLAVADVVSLHASLAASNPLRFDDELFGKMRKGSWIVNMARGDMVDDEALARAIDGGVIAGAALDVFPEEPYRGVLCQREEVILSPHQATLTVETRSQMETEAVENLLEELRRKRG